MTSKPAILGGAPIFASTVNIVRPSLPSFADLASDAVELFSSGMVTKGRHLRAFEDAVAIHLGVRHAVAVSSCTTGLMLTYKCLGLTGDVVVPSFTFMATVSALLWAGLKPVFADVDYATTNIDLASIEAAITPNTTGIVAVHNFGNPADLEGLQSLADRKGLILICDAAHGFGSLYKGKRLGPQAAAHIFSLSPTKLVIAGEGGVIATNSGELAEQVRMGREYGNDGRYNSVFPGINARMPEFNALMGLHSLRRLEQAVQRRNQIASLYHQALDGIAGIGFQRVENANRNSYKDFSITVEKERLGLSRDHLARALSAENVDTRNYYDPPVHRHSAYAQFAPTRGFLSNTELLSSRSLSLPIWSEMRDEIVLDICRAIKRIHEFAAEVSVAVNPTSLRVAHSGAHAI